MKCLLVELNIPWPTIHTFNLIHLRDLMSFNVAKATDGLPNPNGNERCNDCECTYYLNVQIVVVVVWIPDTKLCLIADLLMASWDFDSGNQMWLGPGVSASS